MWTNHVKESIFGLARSDLGVCWKASILCYDCFCVAQTKTKKIISVATFHPTPTESPATLWGPQVITYKAHTHQIQRSHNTSHKQTIFFVTVPPHADVVDKNTCQKMP